ncbi:MAG: hypothetical protein MJA83_02585 [Gammaproteobacteria bacterium]|nr:hypothetical protein [Gammaproteobacteria bacterium]
MERVIYYFELLATLCGFDGRSGYSIPGMIVVLLALVAVIYAFYRAIISTIWPGETARSHIKHRILSDEENHNAY